MSLIRGISFFSFFFPWNKRNWNSTMEIFHELRAMVFWSLFNKNYIIILEIKDRFNNYAMVREFCFAGKILILKGIGEHVILYYIILYYYVQGRCARLFEKGEKREWSLSTRDPFTLTVNQLSVERLLEKKEKCLHKRPPLYCQPTSTAIGWIPAKKKNNDSLRSVVSVA